MEKIIINNLEAKYKFINNKAKNTLLLIHGFDSSFKAFDPLYKSKNFNMLGVNYPNGEHNIKELANFYNNIISKIKGKVFVVGHSLGGAIAAHLRDRSKIKRFIFVSSLTEILVNIPGFEFFEAQNKKENPWAIKAAGVMLSSIGKESLSKFLNPPSGFRKVIKENISNSSWLKQNLTEEFKSKSNKSEAYIGSSDLLFDDIQFKAFMDKINIKTTILKDATHNPFSSTKELNKILEEKIPFKKKKYYKNIFNPHN